MPRIINILLSVIALAGLMMLVRQRQTFSALKEQHDRLAAKYGVLEVKDPSKYAIERLETADLNHFLWRCYFPASLQIKEVVSIGPGARSMGSSYRSQSSEFLMRCRFQFEDEQISVHYIERGGAGRMSFRSDLVPFLKEHWDELEFEALASDGAVELATDQPLPFLTIRIPDHLISELPKHLQNQFSSGVLFEMLYGTAEAVDPILQQRAGISP